MKSVGVILKPSNIPQFKPFIQRFHHFLAQANAQAFYLECERERLSAMGIPASAYRLVSEQQLFNNSELIFSLGGDGTLIGTCRQSAGSMTPIVGVNLGHLGFTTEYTRDEIFDDLPAILSGSFTTCPLPLFQVTVNGQDDSQAQYLFLNDAVFAKKDIARMFEISVHTADEVIYKLIGDGLIVSSPIGSTAYSMAAGGPIIHRQVAGMVLTPICPHSLTKRPIVLPNNLPIIIEPSVDDGQIALTLDGQVLVTLAPGSTIHLQCAAKKANLVQNPRHGFFQTLNLKFANSSRDL